MNVKDNRFYREPVVPLDLEAIAFEIVDLVEHPSPMDLAVTVTKQLRRVHDNVLDRVASYLESRERRVTSEEIREIRDVST